MTNFIMIQNSINEDSFILYAAPTMTFLGNGSFEDVHHIVHLWCKKAKGSDLRLEMILKNFVPQGFQYPIHQNKVRDLWDTKFEDIYASTLDKWQEEGLKMSKPKKVRPILIKTERAGHEDMEEDVEERPKKVIKKVVHEEKKRPVIVPKKKDKKTCVVVPKKKKKKVILIRR